MWQILCDTLAPFLWGGSLALVLNIPMTWLEQRFQWLNPKLRRAVSLTLLSVGMLGIAALGLWLLVPQIVSTLEKLAGDMPQIQSELMEMLGGHGEGMLRSVGNPDTLRPLMQTGVKMVQSAAALLGQIGLGMVLALYLLASKESNQSRVRRLCLALFGPERTQKIAQIASQSAKVFGGFVVGQCLEACILTSMFLVTLFVLRFPCVVPISIIIGVTALLPVFGAWIGGGIGFLLTLSAGTRKALFFIVVFLVVQEVENQLIYPRVVGGKIGLPPLWVLAGVLLGGGLLGPAGLFLGIPLLGVIYDQGRRWVHFRLDKSKKL